MRFQATHDLLTSLWNRGVILEQMSREIQRSRREKKCTTILLCDIDHFKQVTDNYGHSTGDEVLQEVARRLQHSVRAYDLVGRYGGEEFLVILSMCDSNCVHTRAEVLRGVIAKKPIATRSGNLTVTMSIGVALSTDFVQHGVDALMQEADMALPAAKAAGRNCVRVAQPRKNAENSGAALEEITTQRS